MSLDWPAGIAPLELPDFETRARKLRYQALGALCKKQDLTYLMTAHHKDDQAETILMRLVSGAAGMNLQGIKGCTGIPECWGSHGVHESGRYEIGEESLIEWKRLGQNKHPQDHELSTVSRSIIEGGGVHIIRPLLAFEKLNLIKTCEANEVAWEEDRTNQECWRNSRNAIRSLLKDNLLPLALRQDSVLHLVDRITARKFSMTLQVRKELARCAILNLDLRSGVLTVRMPKTLGECDSKLHKDPVASRQQIAARLLEYFVSKITPFETIRLQSLQNAVEAVFEDCTSSQSIKTLDCLTFTAGGVTFQRKYPPYAQQELSQSLGLEPMYIWSLSRQPFRSPPHSLLAPRLSHILHQSRSSTRRLGLPSQAKEIWTAWQLWDGRYWIRIKNLSDHTLSVRSLCKDDMRCIQNAMSRDAWRALCATIRQTAPGKIRWTLPAIIEKHRDGMRQDKVLVLPSLGRVGRVEITDQNGAAKLEWDIRYKSVTLRMIDGIFDPRIDDFQTNIVSGNDKDIITSWED